MWQNTKCDQKVDFFYHIINQCAIKKLLNGIENKIRIKFHLIYDQEVNT